MMPSEFAGLTTASTGIDHRSAFATCTCIQTLATTSGCKVSIAS
jgi:hypothetical protein